MQKFFASPSRIALGFTLLGALTLGGLGCGGGGTHPNPDAGKDGGKAGADATGAAGSDATGTGGNDGSAGATGGAGATGTAGNDGGAGATGGTGVAGNDGGAGADAAAGKDGAAGNDGGAGADAAAGHDGAAGADAAGSDASDGGASDASDGGDAAADVPCTNACTLGAKQCGGGGIQTCVMGSSTCTVWGTAATCGTGGHESCTGASGSASCTCNVDPSCGNGTATFCATTSSQSNCGTDADGCFFVASTNACPAHQDCRGNNPTGACDCTAPAVECMGAAGTVFCATSTSLSTCKTDNSNAKNCIYADTAVACSQNKSCTTPSAGAAVCACNADPAGCTTGTGDSCGAGNTSLHCALTSDSCPVGTVTQCNGHSTCDGTTGLCQCNAAPIDCATAGTTCNGNTVVTCAMDGACLYKSAADAACNAHSTCQGAAGAGACVCNTAPAGCTGSGSFCTNTSTQSLCQMDGACPFTVSANDHTCPANQTCKSATLGQTCSCDNTCTAAQAGAGVGTYCLDATHQQTCTNDPNGCHLASALVACPGIQTCQGGDGSGHCQCLPLDVTVGTGCTTPGATVCQGDVVLTCTNDGVTICNSWVATTDCPGAGHVCGTKSGVAACQCGAHVGGDYYADPTLGTDAASGLFATGNNSPADCRFKTLTDGLIVATTAGNRVIAASSTLPAIFGSETFPLAVSPGVTLTGETVSLPSNYVVQFKTGAATAVSLGTSSTVEGLTVEELGGNGAASAISITGTGSIVDTVILDGPLATGIDVTGQGLINAATITGFTTGVRVASGSGLATLLDNSNVDGNVTGVAISAGMLSATSTTVNGGSGNGVVVSATGTLNGSSLIVKGMTGAGISASGAAAVNLTSGELGPNTGNGLTLTGGSATLGFVNIHNNAVGIAQSGGTIALGSGGAATVQSNAGNGVTLTGGTLTVSNGGITGNGGDGVNAAVGTTLVSNTGAQYNSNTGNGIAETSATLTFNGSAGAPILLVGNKADGILMNAGGLTANYLTLSTNGSAGTKTSGLELKGIVAVTIGNLSDAAVSITANGYHGVNINGTAIGSTVTLSRASITNNGADGVSVDLNGGATNQAAVAALSSLTITGNGSSGIEVLRAPAAVSAVVLNMDSLTVSGNGTKGAAAGVYLNGVSGAVAATLTNSKISSNTGLGIHISNNGVGSMTETLQGNDVNQNTTNGILFDGVTTLSGFSGNAVHGNFGDQILITSRQLANNAYNFNNTSINPCDANRNQVYCYGPLTPPGNGIIGIRVSTATNVVVNAQDMNWRNGGPTGGNDFVVGPSQGAGTPAVNISPTCGAVAACP